jgi:hypothetical protein
MDPGYVSHVLSPSGTRFPPTPNNKEMIRRQLWTTDNHTTDHLPPMTAEPTVKPSMNDDPTVKPPMTADPLTTPVKPPMTADPTVKPPMTNDDLDDLMTGNLREQLLQYEDRLERERERDRTADLRERQRERDHMKRERDFHEMQAAALQQRERDLREREQSQGKGKESGFESDVSCFERLCVGDPNVELIDDFAACIQLEKQLCSNKDFKINTLLEFFNQLIEKNPKLLQSFECVKTGGCLQSCVIKFQNQIMSIKNMGAKTLAAVTVLMLSVLGSDVKLKAQAALKSAISVNLETRKIGLLLVSAQGSLPAFETQLAKLPVKDQRGMTEAIESPELAVEIYSSISAYVVAFVCFDQNKKLKLMEAEKTYRAFNAAEYRDFYLMMAEEQRLFDVCTSWFGRELMGDYHRNQNLISGCPELVQRRWAAHVSDKGMDEINMAWSEFNAALLIVWTAAFRESNLLDAFGFVPAPVGHNSNGANPHVRQVQTRPGPTVLTVTQEFIDRSITCVMCSVAFGFSAAQQQKFRELNYEPPKRCPGCRPTKQCDQFAETGNCSFGTNCKFAHGAKQPTVMIIDEASDDVLAISVPAVDFRVCVGCGGSFEFSYKRMSKNCEACYLVNAAKSREKQREQAVLMAENYSRANSDDDDW